MASEEQLEKELEIRNKNAYLAKTAGNFSAEITLEQAEQFLHSVRGGVGGVSEILLSGFAEKVELTRKWKTCFSVPNHDACYDGKIPDLATDMVLGMWYEFYGRANPTPMPVMRDYAHPLPVVDYALKKRGRMTKAETKAQQIAGGNLPMILSRAPWLNLLHIEPATEALLTLATKTKEERLKEKETLKEKCGRMNMTLETALILLAQHRTQRLLLVPELGKLRSLVEVSLNFQIKTVQRFPFLDHILCPGEAEIWEEHVLGNKMHAETLVTKQEILDTLFATLLEVDKLVIQIPVKRRIVDTLIVYYDWRIRAQCICHKFPETMRPRPWHESEFSRSVELFSLLPQKNFDDVFEADIQNIPAVDAATQAQALNHAITCRPLRKFLQGVNVRFFYVVECVRHFHRVFSEMCDLCSSITTIESDNLFWISCDKCEKWFHGPCAALVEPSEHFVCPACVIADPYAPAAQKQAATVIISACASVGPKRMGQPRAVVQKVLEEGERIILTRVLDTPETAILRRNITPRP
jgi:hypothetical protein